MMKKKKLVKKSKVKKKIDSKMKKVFKEYGKGELHSGSKKGPKVTSDKQAVAIALSEGRRTASKKKKK